jgi:hypothetical protein
MLQSVADGMGESTNWRKYAAALSTPAGGRGACATCENSGTGRKFYLRESRLSRSQFTNDLRGVRLF